MNANSFTIKRARDFYLYDAKGTRKVDFCLGNGTAVLGHRFQKLQNIIKNTISKGYLGCSNTQEHVRAVKHLHALAPHWNLMAILPRSAYYCLSEEIFFKNKKIDKVLDLVLDEDILVHLRNNVSSTAVLWRSFSGIDLAKVTSTNTEYLAILLPIHWGNGLVAVYSKTPVAQDEIIIDLSSALLSAINYMLPHLVQKAHNMQVKGKGVHSQEYFGVRDLPNQAKNREDIVVLDADIAKNTKRYKFANLPLASAWRRQGIYIVLPEYSAEEYRQVWNTFFERGFYFSEHKQTRQGIANTHIPRVLTIPACITLHELSLWEEAMQIVDV